MRTSDQDEKDLLNDSNRSESEAHRTRRDLALIMTGLVVIVALVAAYQEGAMPVLDKILPLVTLALGFFFGQRAAKL